MLDLELKRANWRKANNKYRQTEKGKRAMMRASHKSYEKNHAKHIARATLRINVVRGKVSKPDLCEANDYRCEGQLEGHHPDYSKPLEVIWLCIRHHTDLHLKLRLAKVV